ncbi:MAG TPA: tetratricopeptide repeat protein, partial [Thermoanaerobaculia bacterium]|nr:tetratricopeptide repeat protein [Thermoanaerobaculia bacterium]
EQESDSAAAWFGLGQIAAQRRDATAAIAAFERVLSLQPEASIAHYPLAIAYRDRGDAERAKEHLALRGEGAVRSGDPLVRELTTLSKLSALQVVLSQAADPQVAARDLVGFAIGQLAGVEGAVDYLRAAIERRPAGEQALDPFARSRVLDVVGALLVEQDRLDDAASAFEEALGVAPDLADAAVRLGNLRGRQRRFTDALDRYDAVLAREPRNAEALLGRADALAFLGRDVEALDSLDRLEAISPGQGRIVLRSAAALERLGRDDRALDRYREAASIAANDAQAATAQTGIGRLLAARGEDQAAREALATAARLDATAAAPRLELGAVEARLRRYQEAARHYGEAVALDSSNEAARVGEASALLLAGEWVQARARLEGGARMLPGSITLRHLLARLLAACPDRALRDGARSVALAEELARGDATPAIRETRAMALAQVGEFDRAAALQAELIEVNQSAGDGRPAAVEATATRLGANLDLYRRGQRCCASDDPALLLP